MHKNKSNLTERLNSNRIYLFLIGIVLIITLLEPKFLKAGNVVSFLETSIIFIITGIGFTYVMIAGHFDLSIGSMINVGAVVSIGSYNYFFKLMGGSTMNLDPLVPAWILGLLCAILAGGIFGLINGLLVAKGKVHSFIVTIGMLTALSGFVYTFCDGNTLSASNYVFTDFIDGPVFSKAVTRGMPLLKVLTPRFIIMILLVVVFEVLLQKTKWGRNFFMTGSNKEVAWQAGIKTDKMVISSFVISGIMAVIAGALFAISMNAAVPNYGERGISPLSVVLAATIIGGTTMTGGSGSVLKTAVAVITIQALFSGIIILGAGFDLQVFTAGIMLSSVVLFEAYSIYRQNQKKGIRPQLIPEALKMKAARKGKA